MAVIRVKHKEKSPVKQFFRNLSTDMKNVTVGLFPGLYHLGKGLLLNPGDTISDLSKGFKETSFLYAVLTSDFEEAGRRIYENPFSSLLEFSGAGSLVGKAGKAGSMLVRGKPLVTTKVVDLGVALNRPERGFVYKVYSDDVWKRFWQETRERVNKALSDHSVLWRRGIRIGGSTYGGFGPEAWFERNLTKARSARGKASLQAARSMGVAFYRASAILHNPKRSKILDQWARNVLFPRYYNNLVRHAGYTTKSFVEANKRQAPPEGYLYVKKPELIDYGKRMITKKRFEEIIDQWGKYHTTTKLNEAWIDAKGRPLLVFRHDTLAYSTELKTGNTILKNLYVRPSKAWKWSVLWAPRYLTNSAIGTALMIFNTMSPTEFMMGVLSAAKAERGERFAKLELNNLVTETTSKWVDEFYTAPHKGFMEELGEQWENLLTKGSSSPGAARKIVAKSHKVGAYWFDTTAKIEVALRGLSIRGFVAAQPEVKALMKKGMTLDDAAWRASLNPRFRAKVNKFTESSLGQYYHFNETEKFIKTAVPFYAWDRAIVTHFFKGLDPVRREVLAQIGFFGSSKVEEEFGKPLANYLKTIIPLGKAGKDVAGIPAISNRFPVLQTFGMNPYAALAEAATPLTETEPVERLAGINPLLLGLMATLGQQKSISGEPIPERSPIGGIPGSIIDAFAYTVESLPQVRIIQAATGVEKPDTYTTTKGRQPYLFSRQWQELLAGYLGIPIKQASITAIQRKRAREAKKRIGGI